MTEEQLEHLIRASGAILGDDAVWVIGSQSILPWLRKHAGRLPSNWPQIFTLSTEADFIPVDDNERKADLIEGSLGEDSYFHASFGVYAQGVSMGTAVLPEGWQSRCYPLKNRNTMGIIGYCLHPADLFIAKSVANREKDSEFLDAMIEHGLVRKSTVLHLLPKISDRDAESLARLRERIVGRFQKIEFSPMQSGDQKIPRVLESVQRIFPEERLVPGKGRINAKVLAVTDDAVVLRHNGREKLLDAQVSPEQRETLKGLVNQPVVLHFDERGLKQADLVQKEIGNRKERGFRGL
jgi:hypothetical protein